MLIGSLNRFAREDANNYGSWYHGKLYVDTPAGPYECAVDVSTPSGVQVQYRVVHYLNPNLFSVVSSLPVGWHPLTSNSTYGALDYVRSPLLHGFQGCLTVLASPIIDAINAFLRNLFEAWADSTGDNALDVMDSLLTVGGKVFVFGAPYTTGRGVHDIQFSTQSLNTDANGLPL